MKKLLTKLYPLLNNLWFVLWLVIVIVDGVYYYAEYFNLRLQMQLDKYELYKQNAYYAFMVLFAVASIIFVVKMSKKGDEQDRHYPNRFIIFILLMGLLFLADESLKLIKEKPFKPKIYCNKIQMDPSTAEFKPIFDYILKTTANMPKYHELESMLPCVVIKKDRMIETTGEGAFTSFDIKNAKEGYLPLYVDQNMDISNTKLTTITMIHPLSMAYDFMQEKETVNGKVASCLQRLVNAYGESSLFILATSLDKDPKSEKIPGVDDPNISASQREQIRNLNFQFEYFYLDSMDACTKSLGSADSPGFPTCVTEERFAVIEDFVYNQPAYRNYCAYR